MKITINNIVFEITIKKGKIVNISLPREHTHKESIELVKSIIHNKSAYYVFATLIHLGIEYKSSNK